MRSAFCAILVVATSTAGTASSSSRSVLPLALTIPADRHRSACPAGAPESTVCETFSWTGVVRGLGRSVITVLERFDNSRVPGAFVDGDIRSSHGTLRLTGDNGNASGGRPVFEVRLAGEGVLSGVEGRGTLNDISAYGSGTVAILDASVAGPVQFDLEAPTVRVRKARATIAADKVAVRVVFTAADAAAPLTYELRRPGVPAPLARGTVRGGETVATGRFAGSPRLVTLVLSVTDANGNSATQRVSTRVSRSN